MSKYAIWYGDLFDGVTLSETIAEEARQRGATVVEVPEGTPLTLCALTAGVGGATANAGHRAESGAHDSAFESTNGCGIGPRSGAS